MAKQAKQSNPARMVEVTNLQTGYTRTMTVAEFHKTFGRKEGNEIIAGYMPGVSAIVVDNPEPATQTPAPSPTPAIDTTPARETLATLYSATHYPEPEPARVIPPATVKSLTLNLDVSQLDARTVADVLRDIAKQIVHNPNGFVAVQQTRDIMIYNPGQTVLGQWQTRF